MFPYAGVMVGTLLLVLVVTLRPGVEALHVPARTAGIGAADLQLARVYGEMYRMPREFLLDGSAAVTAIEAAGWDWSAPDGYWTRECGAPATESLVDTGFASSEGGNPVAQEGTCVYDTALVVKTGGLPVRRCGRMGVTYDAGGGERYAGAPGGGPAAMVSGELVSRDLGGSHAWSEWDWRPVLAGDPVSRKMSVSGTSGSGVLVAAGGVDSGGTRLPDARSPWRLQGYGLSGWTEDGVTTTGGVPGTNPRRAELFVAGANCWFDVEGVGRPSPFVVPMGALEESVRIPGLALNSLRGADGPLNSVQPGRVADWTARLQRGAAIPLVHGSTSYGGAFHAVADPDLGLAGAARLPMLPAGSTNMSRDARRGVMPSASGWRSRYCEEIAGLSPGTAEYELCAWQNW